MEVNMERENNFWKLLGRFRHLLMPSCILSVCDLQILGCVSFFRDAALGKDNVFYGWIISCPLLLTVTLWLFTVSCLWYPTGFGQQEAHYQPWGICLWSPQDLHRHCLYLHLPLADCGQQRLDGWKYLRLWQSSPEIRKWYLSGSNVLLRACLQSMYKCQERIHRVDPET